MKARSYASSLICKHQNKSKRDRYYICRHLRALVEGNRLLAVTEVLLVLDIHVGQTCQILVGNQGHFPGGLEVRLVEAGERLGSITS